jgi:hypothetical protein
MHVANPFPVLRNQVGKILQDSGRDRRIAWDRLGITHWEAEVLHFGPYACARLRTNLCIVTIAIQDSQMGVWA